MVSKSPDTVAPGYRLQSADTDPVAEQVQFGVWRRMTPGQKLQLLEHLHRAAQLLTDTGIRQRHPAATPREVFLRRVALRLDRQTMIRVYGWDPAAA